VPTAIYYPLPLHRQTAYARFPVATGGLPVTDDLAARVLSIPVHPYLHDDELDRVVDALVTSVGGGRG
jgi:UDP-2-acetamido-2-deoxy-ribo-hexuluronate aminotransferase